MLVSLFVCFLFGGMAGEGGGGLMLHSSIRLSTNATNIEIKMINPYLFVVAYHS